MLLGGYRKGMQSMQGAAVIPRGSWTSGAPWPGNWPLQAPYGILVSSDL